MFSRKVILIAAATTLAVVPLAAQAAPAARTAEPVAEESELRGNLLWIFVVIAIVLGLYFVLDKNKPDSP